MKLVNILLSPVSRRAANWFWITLAILAGLILWAYPVMKH